MAEPVLKGVFPPILTVLDEEERVDEAGFERLIERLIEGCVHGLYVLGTNGEGIALRETERRRAAEIAIRTVGGRVPVVCSAVEASTARAIDDAKRIEDMGADATAATPPCYYPVGDDEILNHYEQVAASVTLPLFIYNIPSTTKVMVGANLVKRLTEIENIRAIKDSSMQWANFVSLMAYFREDPGFSVFAGGLPTTGSALLMGADGSITGVANLVPARVVALYDAAGRGDEGEVYRIQAELSDLNRILGYGSGIVCLKTALELMGVCGATATAPHVPVSADAREAIRGILEQHGLLDGEG